jgi:hypothetical protein
MYFFLKFKLVWRIVLLMALCLVLPSAAAAQGCPPISPLPCDQIQAPLPVSLTFGSSISGTVTDKNGAGLGFRMIDAYSGTRLSADGTPSNTSVPGYEPSKLLMSYGTLKLTTNKGIAYLTNNNQLNALGVQVDSRGRLQVEVIIQ